MVRAVGPAEGRVVVGGVGGGGVDGGSRLFLSSFFLSFFLSLVRSFVPLSAFWLID